MQKNGDRVQFLCSHSAQIMQEIFIYDILHYICV